MKFKIHIACYLFFQTISSLQSTGQCTGNILINPGFETSVQVNIGDNPTGSSAFNSWTIPAGYEFNIIKTDGSVYGEGPDNAADGIQYADVAKNDGLIQQDFTLSCPSVIDFSGFFSRREAAQGSNFSSYIEIINSSGTVVATSSIITFTEFESQEVWKQVTGTASIPAGTYTFSFYVNNFANCDNAFLCVTPFCVLPVKLNLFDAAAEKCNTKLTWISSAETGLKEYEVQYSNDGIAFNEIGTVKAANALYGTSYHFTHAAPFNVQGYYRLKITDQSGSYNFTQILQFKNTCAGEGITMIYPNPVKDVLNINTGSQNVSPFGKAVIYNAQGKAVSEKNIKNGNNSIVVKALPAGTYYLKITVAEKTRTYSIVKY